MIVPRVRGRRLPRSGIEPGRRIVNATPTRVLHELRYGRYRLLSGPMRWASEHPAPTLKRHPLP